METKAKTKRGFKVPQILVLILMLVVVFSILSYIVPGGQFQLDENNRVIPGTFEYIAKNPVSPWEALLTFYQGIVDAGSIIALLLVSGGSVGVVIGTGCFEKLINFGVCKLEDKSVKILVPGIVVLMSLLGAFAGNDSLIAFVAVGLIVCGKLKLDRVCAMAMFYLAYLIGQGASFTSVLLITVQTMCEVAPLSSMQIRIVIWIVFTAVTAVYCTRYALKITKDPSKSITGIMTGAENADAAENTDAVEKVGIPFRAILTILVLFGCYVVYAVGGKLYGWGSEYLVALMVLDAIFTVLIYQINPNEAGTAFFKGAQGMGGICVVLGFARVIGTILNNSMMINTIANGAASLFSGMGLMVAALGIFVFIMLFNLLIPSGTSKAAILLPLVCPIGDVLGLTRDVVVMIYMIGDSLTNTLTPVSGPLVGSLGLANVEYSDWLKFAAPLMGILAVVGGGFIAVLAGIGWVG